MSKFTKMISCAMLILVSLVSQNVSAVTSAADRAFLGLAADAYPIGGQVTGLTAGREIVLYNNGSDPLVVSQNGLFVFSNFVAKDASYQVTIAAQPEGQICVVQNGAGTVTGPVTTVQVQCVSVPQSFSVGGSVTGLFPRSAGLVIQNNGDDALRINNNGAFTFPRRLADGQPYAVRIVQQPVNQLCMISNSDGKIVNRNVNDIGVTCLQN